VLRSCYGRPSHWPGRFFWSHEWSLIQHDSHLASSASPGTPEAGLHCCIVPRIQSRGSPQTTGLVIRSKARSKVLRLSPGRLPLGTHLCKALMCYVGNTPRQFESCTSSLHTYLLLPAAEISVVELSFLTSNKEWQEGLGLDPSPREGESVVTQDVQICLHGPRTCLLHGTARDALQDLAGSDLGNWRKPHNDHDPIQ
jgi:hypothetical protein